MGSIFSVIKNIMNEIEDKFLFISIAFIAIYFFTSCTLTFMAHNQILIDNVALLEGPIEEYYMPEYSNHMINWDYVSFKEEKTNELIDKFDVTNFSLETVVNQYYYRFQPIPSRKPDLLTLIADFSNIVVPKEYIKGFDCDDEREDPIIVMACNLYFEARGETALGMLAVAEVVKNRVESDLYPNTIPDVVWQDKQFSWTQDGNHDRINIRDKGERNAWITAIKISIWFNKGNKTNFTRGALFYHADYVIPSWAKRFRRTRVIGAHIFYINT